MSEIKTYPEMNETIKDLLRRSDEPMNRYILARIEELEKQVSSLAPPPNDPLTLDKLREMDGEPVWVVTGSAINAGRGHWDICDWWDKDTVMFPYSGEQPRIDECGITWWAYRRKPEEVSL